MSEKHRPIAEIAHEIKREWHNPYFGARPYIDAMEALVSIDDNYYHDSGRSVVLYFLANAGTWRGDAARRIKKELKQIAGVR